MSVHTWKSNIPEEKQAIEKQSKRDSLATIVFDVLSILDLIAQTISFIRFVISGIIRIIKYILKRFLSLFFR